MSRRQLVMSKRSEKAKRLNANHDNLLHMEMERFEKQHTKEMKSILLERQIAKEAMSDIRRHRASSLLAARMALQENNALNNHADISPTLSKKVFCEAKQSPVSSRKVQGLETHDERPLVWEPRLPNPVQKTSSLKNKYLDLNCNATSLPSRNDHFGRPRTRAQTFSEGTTPSNMIHSSETHEGTPLVGKPFLPNPAHKTSSLNPKTSGYLSVPLLPSKNDHYGESRARARTFTEGTAKAQYDLEDGSSRELKLDPLTFSNNNMFKNQYREQQGNSAVKDIPILKENVEEDSRPRSRSDVSMLFKRIPTPTTRLEKSYLSANVSPNSPRFKVNSPEPDSVVEDSRPRSRSDVSMLFKRIPTPTTRLEKSYLSPNASPNSPRFKVNSPEPESVVEDSRPRSRSDDSMLFKPTPTTRLEKSYLSANVSPNSPRSKENSPEPDGSPSLRVPLPLSPQVERRVCLDASRLLFKRSSLQLPCMPLTQPQKRELSPSRGIAKFRQTGSAASAAQTLVSRYQREKAISKATENLIAERQKREKLRQEHQQMKEEWTKAGRTRADGLKHRFFTIAQLVMALNALKKEARSRRPSFAEEIE